MKFGGATFPRTQGISTLPRPSTLAIKQSACIPRAGTYIVKSGRQTNCYNSAGAISFFDFCLVFKSKMFDQNMPFLEGPVIPQNGGTAKPPLQFTLYLHLLGGVYLGQICCFTNLSKHQKNKFQCRIIAVVLFPSLYYINNNNNNNNNNNK